MFNEKNVLVGGARKNVFKFKTGKNVFNPLIYGHIERVFIFFFN